MKAAYIEATGPAQSTIKFGDVPKPQASGAQVLVKVGAVGFILVPGLTMPWLIKRLDLGRRDEAEPVAAPAAAD